MLKTCPDCNGDGVVDNDTDNERQCLTCVGRGFVPYDGDHKEAPCTVVVCLPSLGGKYGQEL